MNMNMNVNVNVNVMIGNTNPMLSCLPLACFEVSDVKVEVFLNFFGCEDVTKSGKMRIVARFAILGLRKDPKIFGEIGLHT